VSDLSMYQRLSAHLTSVDLPQLDLLDSISRETKSRVETFAFSSTQVANNSKYNQHPSSTVNNASSPSNTPNAVINLEKTCPS